MAIYAVVAASIGCLAVEAALPPFSYRLAWYAIKMGPVLLFDKSLLQSLNPDEAMWMDNFFLSNITPLFFIETLADLEKEVRKGRTPEAVVGNLAYKTPDSSSGCNAHHEQLLQADLLGWFKLDMVLGRPHVSQGQTLELGGKMGTTIMESPEQEAFKRWQDGKFLELERQHAKNWRMALSNIDLESIYREFQGFFPVSKPKTLAGVKQLVDFYLAGENQKQVLLFGLATLGVAPDYQSKIVARWDQSKATSIHEFAPYFTHVLSVDLFFNIGIAADLIGRGRPSHKIDMAYLYYLPFCRVFTSQDNLHKSIAPLFLNERQSFVDGLEFKQALAALDTHYSALPDEVKSRGVVTFATLPPLQSDLLVTQLWDKHMSPQWREQAAKPHASPNEEEGKKLVKEMNQFEKEGTPVTHPIDPDLIDHMIIKRMVSNQKGKWKRYPPEVVNRRKNADGEWEDIPPQ